MVLEGLEKVLMIMYVAITTLLVCALTWLFLLHDAERRVVGRRSATDELTAEPAVVHAPRANVKRDLAEPASLPTTPTAGSVPLATTVPPAPTFVLDMTLETTTRLTATERSARATAKAKAEKKEEEQDAGLVGDTVGEEGFVLPLCDGMDAEPTCQPLRSVRQLLRWGHVHAAEDVVSTAADVRPEETDDVFSAAGVALGSSDGGSGNGGCGSGGQRATRPQLLVCHDMMGGYLDDRLPQGSTPGGDDDVRPAPAYRLYHWEMIDVFTYFSHQLVSVPPPAWINAAHRHGTRVLGTLLTEWDRGAQQCAAMLDSRARAAACARALATLAARRGFEGWLVNIENPVAPAHIPTLLFFLQELRRETRQRVGAGAMVLWYDAVTTEGLLQWQDRLSPLNAPFFDACDGIFVNYTWKPAAAALTAAAAGERRFDVFMGVDVFGRGTLGGGGMRSDVALKAIRRAALSAALFAPGWVLENIDSADPHDDEAPPSGGTACKDARFESKQWRFWRRAALAWEEGALALPLSQRAGQLGPAAAEPQQARRPFDSYGERALRITGCGGFGTHGHWQSGRLLRAGRWYHLSQQSRQSLLLPGATATAAMAPQRPSKVTVEADAPAAHVSTPDAKAVAANAVRLRHAALLRSGATGAAAAAQALREVAAAASRQQQQQQQGAVAVSPAQGATLTIRARHDDSRAFDGGRCILLQGVTARGAQLALPVFRPAAMRMPGPLSRRRRAAPEERKLDGGGGLEVRLSFLAQGDSALCVYLRFADGRTLVLRAPSSESAMADDASATTAADRVGAVVRAPGVPGVRAPLPPSRVVATRPATKVADGWCGGGRRFFLAPSAESTLQAEVVDAGMAQTRRTAVLRDRVARLRRLNQPPDEIASILSQSPDVETVDTTGGADLAQLPWCTRSFCVLAADVGGGGRVAEVGVLCVLRPGAKDGLHVFRAWVGELSIAPFERFSGMTAPSAAAAAAHSPATGLRQHWLPPRCVEVQCYDRTVLEAAGPDGKGDLLCLTLGWRFEGGERGGDVTEASAMQRAGVGGVNVWLLDDDSGASWLGRAHVRRFRVQLRLPLPSGRSAASAVRLALQSVGLLGQRQPLAACTTACLQLF